MKERKTHPKKKKENKTIIGTMHSHPRGFGFVDVDNLEQDVFIPKSRMLGAIGGDTVAIEIYDIVSDKGPEGRVIEIVKRSKTHLIGTVQSISDDGILAYVPMFSDGRRVIVSKPEGAPLQVGDRLILEVEEWGDEKSDTRCIISKHMGNISDASLDNEVISEEFGLRNAFPDKVLKEVNMLPSSVLPSDIENREDLRKSITITIDPTDSKDFDDALSLEIDDRGHYHLGVHIADVAHYVKAATAIDQEALLRCNSTYFPGRCIPMLPPKLADNVCSLKPGVERLTMSVIMEYDREGTKQSYRIVRSVIQSKKRFTYAEAKEVLDGVRESEHAPLLKNLVDLCMLFKKNRAKRGCVELALPEVRIVVDDEGVPTGTEFIEYDITHQLVEECMLQANEAIATHIGKNGKALPYRIHPEPAAQDFVNLVEAATTLGFKLPALPTSIDIQKLFKEVENTQHARHLSVCFIKSMPLAYYSSENIGHYGLGLEYYCHFTSPIRRYSDLIVQRILFNETTLSDNDIDIVAEACSEQERISARAEGAVKILKKLRYILANKERDSSTCYDALVVKITERGLIFEIPELMIEGFLRLSELEGDYFIYEKKTGSLRGRKSGAQYHIGSALTVMPKRINLIKAEARWDRIP